MLYLPFRSTMGIRASIVAGAEQLERASTTKAFCPLNVASFNLGVLKYVFFILPVILLKRTWHVTSIHLRISMSRYPAFRFGRRPDLISNRLRTFLRRCRNHDHAH